MPRLWARTVDFQTLAVGDQLPIMVKWETVDSIRRLVAKYGPADQCYQPETDDLIPEDQAVAVPEGALAGYVTELLGKAFPVDSITAEGSALEVDPLEPINADDTISVFGEVVAKREDGGLRLVECRVVIEKESGQNVATVRAVVSL